jgi:hypothetical protein
MIRHRNIIGRTLIRVQGVLSDLEIHAYGTIGWTCEMCDINQSYIVIAVYEDGYLVHQFDCCYNCMRHHYIII